MKKLSPLVLSLLCSSAVAGSYVDQGADTMTTDNKNADHHFYVDIGVNGYYFDQPGMTLPFSTGYSYPDNGYPRGTNPDQSNDGTAWATQPTLTLGYEFLTTNVNMQKIFGEQNAIELRAAYFKDSSNTTDHYPEDYYVNPWFITGSSETYNHTGESYVLEQADWNFDNTYYALGLYYTGNKVLSDQLVNAPYVGISFSYLQQDTDYTAYMTTGGDAYVTEGTDTLNSYYVGIDLGDKLIYLFQRNYALYGKAGLGLYLLHSSLDATQIPVTNEPQPDFSLNATYSATEDDDIATFKLSAETGVTYYFSGNKNPMSTSVTFLVGVEYWNDVAYADNPTSPNEAVSIAYNHSVNPYVGVQLHIPIA